MFVFDRANQTGDAVSRPLPASRDGRCVCVDSTHIFSRRAGLRSGRSVGRLELEARLAVVGRMAGWQRLDYGLTAASR